MTMVIFVPRFQLMSPGLQTCTVAMAPLSIHGPAKVRINPELSQGWTSGLSVAAVQGAVLWLLLLECVTCECL